MAFYHEHVVESLDDDLTIELVDYCVRKITWLIGLPRDAIASNTTFHKSGHEIVQMMRSHCAKRELARQQLEIEFRIAVQCVTMLRYITERLHLLPLSIVSRLLDKHDVLLSLAALIENPPWTHKALVPKAAADPGDSNRSSSTSECKEVKWKKFVNQKWVFVEPSDLLALTSTEAQVWLAIYYLLCTKSAREHYEITQFRKDQLLRIRKYLNDLLLDQLPLLADIQRYLDELSIMQAGGGAGGSGSLVMEAVPYLRLAITRKFGSKYASVAARFDALSAEMNRAEDLRELGEVYQMEGIDELLDGEDKSRVDTGSDSRVETSEEQQSNNGESGASEDARTPVRVMLIFRNRVLEQALEPSATKKPLIVEIGSHEDRNSNEQPVDDVVEIECMVDAASRKEMETKTHRYARYALRPTAKGDTTIACHAAAEAQIWFANSDNLSTASSSALTLACADLQLPTPLASGKREKLWKQIGSLQEESLVVVQCQFVSSETSNQDEDDGAIGYRLGALFLSVPC